MHIDRKHQSGGFTLIELGVVVVLMMMVTTAAIAFWHQIQTSYQFSTTQFQLTDQVNQVLRRMATELRQAEVAMDGAYPLEVLDDNTLAFYADTNQDGLVERVRYFLDGTSLKKGIVVPTGNPPTYVMTNEKISVVVDAIDTSRLPLFYYYNGNWPGDTAHNPLGYWTRPLETRLIKVVIPLVSHSYNQDYRHQSSTIVHIRNLKDNL